MEKKKERKIKGLTIAKTFNIGNYESIKVELSTDIEEGEEYRDVVDDLYDQILATKKYLISS